MLEISKFLWIQHAFLFWFAEHTYLSHFLKNKNIFLNKSVDLPHLYKTNFFLDNNKKFLDKEKNIFFLKFFFLWGKKDLNCFKRLESSNTTIRINRKLYNMFDNSWLRVFNFCNNFLFNFFLNNMKMMILDSDYKNHFFFISHNFQTNYIVNESHYFLPKLKNFSNKSWVYFFSKFCDKRCVSAFFVSDSVLVNRNVSSIASIGLPIISFLVHKNDNLIDYSFFFSVKSSYYYYLLSSIFINYTYFISLNHKLLRFKYLYVKRFSYLIGNVVVDSSDSL